MHQFIENEARPGTLARASRERSSETKNQPTTPADPLALGACPARAFIPSATFYNRRTGQKNAIESVTGATLSDVTGCVVRIVRRAPVTLSRTFSTGIRTE